MERPIITNRATKDIAKGRDWYETKRLDLGYEFMDFVYQCIEEIHKRPLGYPVKHKYVREMYIRKYPYVIIYSIEEAIIFILRVFPCKNDPQKKYKN
jgi:toxin ParE1/3/4